MNYLAISVAAVINMVVGALWYSPMLFAKPWMKAVGKSEKDLKSVNMGKMYGIMFVGAVLFVYATAYFVNMLQISTVGDAISLGLWAWFGFFMLTTLSDYLFSGRSFTLYATNGGYQLVLFVLSAMILTLWH